MRERLRRTAREPVRPGLSTLSLVLTLAIAGCHRAPSPSHGRYLVTSSPLDVHRGIRLCIAVDLRDPRGVWWWGPGVSGCGSRSTGPGLVDAENAAIAPAAGPGSTAIAFRIGTHDLARPFVDVRLVVDHGRMRSLDTGDAVALQHRNDLAIPERPPGP